MTPPQWPIVVSLHRHDERCDVGNGHTSDETPSKVNPLEVVLFGIHVPKQGVENLLR